MVCGAVTALWWWCGMERGNRRRQATSAARNAPAKPPHDPRLPPSRRFDVQNSPSHVQADDNLDALICPPPATYLGRLVAIGVPF